MRPQFPFPSSLAYPSQVAHSIDGLVRIIRASIKAGESHAIEVLVARCLSGGLEIIEHQTTMVRLGESVNKSGEISRDKLDAARRYKELAQQHGAEQILAIATVAMREARNSKDFLDVLSCLVASHKLDVILKVSFASLITGLAGQRILEPLRERKHNVIGKTGMKT